MTFYGQMDGFIGFRRSKYIGNEVSISNIGIFLFFLLLSRNTHLNYLNWPKFKFSSSLCHVTFRFHQWDIITYKKKPISLSWGGVQVPDS